MGDVNVMQLFFVTQAFLPSMLKRDEGHIVTLASASGLLGVNQMADYSTSKWAAVGFGENLRVELKNLNSNIRTSTVTPIYIDTGMFDGVKTNWIMPLLKPEYVTKRILNAIINREDHVNIPGWIPPFIALVRSIHVGLGDTIQDIVGAN